MSELTPEQARLVLRADLARRLEAASDAAKRSMARVAHTASQAVADGRVRKDSPLVDAVKRMDSLVSEVGRLTMELERS